MKEGLAQSKTFSEAIAFAQRRLAQLRKTIPERKEERSHFLSFLCALERVVQKGLYTLQQVQITWVELQRFKRILAEAV